MQIHVTGRDFSMLYIFFTAFSVVLHRAIPVTSVAGYAQDSRASLKLLCPCPRAPDVHDQHLQAVLHVDKAHVRIVVKRQQLNIREHLLETPGNTAAYDMVGDAAKWLQDDKGCSQMAAG